MLRGLLEARRAKEVMGIIWTGLGVLLVLSLASYSPQDPSFFVSSPSRPANWIGPAGAQIAGFLFEWFGLAAWFLPVISFALALHRLRQGLQPLRRSALLGLVLVGLSTALLLCLLVGRIEFRGAPLQAGGAVGHIAAFGLVSMVSDVGSLVVAGTALLLGLALCARSSLAESAGQAQRTVQRLSPKAGLIRRGAGATGRALLFLVPRWPFRGRRTAAKENPAVVQSPTRTRSSPQAEGIPAKVVERPDEEEQPSLQRSPRTVRTRQAVLPVDLPGPAPAKLPPTELMTAPSERQPVDRQELVHLARQIEARCAEFDVEGQVTEIHPGPVVTTFEFRPNAGIKISRITGLADELALSLEAENVRIDRIPGRPTVGIEVPNRRRETIVLREIIESDAFRKSTELLTIGLGKTQEGEVFCTSLAKMPHLLIAGSTGSGKSVGLNGIITSILYRARPDEVKFILIDPKMLELGLYQGLPHLLVQVVTDMKQAANALKWAVREMDRRYRLLASCNVRHLDAFNRLVDTDLEGVEKAISTIPRHGEGEIFEAKRVPYLIIVVDELADLMMTTGPETEESIARLAQKARAVGIHLVLATQRPSVDVLTGTIKANFPARIAYRVSSKIDSRTILDASGGERLLGAGDMLFRPPGSARLLRIHGAFISEEEGLRILAWLKGQAKAEYDKSVIEDPPEPAQESEEGEEIGSNDPMYRQAVRLVISSGQGSTSFLQRRMRLGYSRAARIIDAMEQEGILGPPDGSRPRQILVDTSYLERMDQQDEE